jgi:hypothetical protein
MGLLCNGPSRGNRVTFTSPRSWVDGWRGVLAPEAAAQVAIPAYLRAYGPASLETFDAWLTRGGSRKSDLHGWFAALEEEQVLARVAVEGEAKPLYALADDVDELKEAAPAQAVRLLPGFDQYVLGPGTGDPRIVPPARRTQVSKAAGWIAPVLISRGAVIGTWEPGDDVLAVSLFAESGAVNADELARETERIGACLGRSVKLTVRTSDST